MGFFRGYEFEDTVSRVTVKPYVIIRGSASHHHGISNTNYTPWCRLLFESTWIRSHRIALWGASQVLWNTPCFPNGLRVLVACIVLKFVISNTRWVYYSKDYISLRIKRCNVFFCSWVISRIAKIMAFSIRFLTELPLLYHTAFHLVL